MMIFRYFDTHSVARVVDFLDNISTYPTFVSLDLAANSLDFRLLRRDCFEFAALDVRMLDHIIACFPIARNRATEEVIQRIASAKDVAAHDFQEWLTKRDRAGFDVYIGMNTLKESACTRTKRDILEIRHVYLDLDYRGPEALKAIHNSDEVPKPNFVLDTSPGKYQIVWKVDGGTPQEAEDLQQQMAHEFGADIAATDVSRVLRLPGFANRKYESECLVRVTKHSDRTYSLRDFKLPSGPAKNERLLEQSPPRLGGQRETITQSERDWAYAKRALARGDNPEEIIRRIADYRADDKHAPAYYARLTVEKAQAEVTTRAVSYSTGPLTDRENDHESSL